VTACHAALMLCVLFVQREGLPALPTSCFDSLQYDNAVDEGELSSPSACSSTKEQPSLQVKIHLGRISNP
jgi:hypothetical protein